MTLSKKSWFVKWCYAVEACDSRLPLPRGLPTETLWDGPPAQTSVCVLFWRMWITPLVIPFLLLFCGATWGVCFVWHGIRAVIIPLVRVSAWLICSMWPRRLGKPTAIKVTAAWLAAKKRKVCPLVRLED